MFLWSALSLKLIVRRYVLWATSLCERENLNSHFILLKNSSINIKFVYIALSQVIPVATGHPDFNPYIAEFSAIWIKNKEPKKCSFLSFSFPEIMLGDCFTVFFTFQIGSVYFHYCIKSSFTPWCGENIGRFENVTKKCWKWCFSFSRIHALQRPFFLIVHNSIWF